MTASRHVSASHLAARTGLTARWFTGAACEGKIPGAVQPSGPGGAWRFDAAKFWRWWNERNREPWQPSIGRRERNTGGVASKGTVESAESHLKRLLGLSPSGA